MVGIPYLCAVLWKLPLLWKTVGINEKGIDLIFDTDDITYHTVLADQKRIRQIIINLLSNSIKYTNSGSITVKACTELSDDGKTVSLPLEY